MRLLTLPTRPHSDRAQGQRRSLAIGNFDGVHLGHRALLGRLQTLAPDCRPTVLSFHPHPLECLARRAQVAGAPPRLPPAPILGFAEKLRRLATVGVQELVLQHFSLGFADCSAVDFVRELLVKRLAVGHVCVGENFRFGKGRQGDVALLQELGREWGFSVDSVSLLHQAGQIVSSGLVRTILAQGDLLSATQLLGEAYSVTGRVIHGAKLGRTLNIPTLNLLMPVNSQGQAVLSGVFVVRVHGLADTTLAAIASVGTRPTVEAQGRVLLEVHVFDFDRQCYGTRVRVEFLHKLREEVRFESLAALSQQMQQDLAAARALHQASSGLRDISFRSAEQK